MNTSPGDLGDVNQPDQSATAFDMGPGCGLNTCLSMGAGCGPIGDGCGGTLDCGKCPVPQTCGGGGVPFQCGGTAACVPLKCGQLNLSCGPAGDGCGGTLDCGTCAAPQTCGGGGVNGQCGTQTTSSTDMAGGLCVPKTCAQLNANCGQIGDGCGNLITCGTMGGGCPGSQTCGGGGVPFQCGSPPCVPKTCAQLGVTCGPTGDGCGGLADGTGNPGGGPGNCGSCSTGSCGGGGVAGQCGSAACVAKTCAQLGLNCGQASDGCGGIATGSGPAGSPCGTCASPQACGASGMPNICGTPACTPKTCAQLGLNCGLAGDGCGGIALNSMGTQGCGTCPTGQVCGLLQPNQCGNTISGTSQCDGGMTTITGTVVAPTDCSLGFCATGQTAGDPIYNATVFIPKNAVTALPVGVPACDQCSSQTAALVQATTGVDGKFTLVNPPTGAQTVVIQLGRWRRVIHINVQPCIDNVLTTAQTRLPRIQGGNTGADDPMDNIPRFAISTGNVDVMECVLRKMGVADTEFVNPNLNGSGVPQATGRVQLYQQLTLTKTSTPKGPGPGRSGAGGAVIDANTPTDVSLWGNTSTIDAYDAVLFPCTGGQDDKPTSALDSVTGYANAGGRVFATHFSYVWTYNTYLNTTANVPWGCGATCSTAGQTVGTWDPDTQYGTFTGFVDTSFPKGVALSQWLQLVKASTTMGQIPVDVVRWDIDNVAVGQQWLYSTNPPNLGPSQFPLHFTFNTDVTKPANQQCGRVVFSDFHVENSGGSNGVAFPTECNGNTPLTPQEKLLEFMLFDLTSCVQPDVPTCTAKSCSQQGYTCGLQGDGCGGIALNSMGTTSGCGTCPSGQVCTNGTCTGGCVPKTCSQLGATCGLQGDGCGGIALNSMNTTSGCGSCSGGQSCIGGTCVGSCVPKTCSQLGATCGVQGDGCGGIALPNPCGSCVFPQTCGGGGVPNQCGGGCVPLTCAQLGLSCGPAGNGCGGMISGGCGSCPMGTTCGGGGIPGQCGAAPDGGVMCQPLTCAAQGLSCGAAGDGCGNLLNCGTCPTGQTCGGGGVPGQCGAPNCTPTTCAAQNANCGIIGDGCGGTINCGACVAPQTCGGGGVPFQCGIIG